MLYFSNSRLNRSTQSSVRGVIMNIENLRYFVNVAKLGSINKATKETFITRQGISSAISKLEEELSSKLFRRSAKGVLLTEIGEYFLPYAQKMVELYDESSNEILRMSQQNRPLPIYFADGSLQEVALPAITQFMEKHASVPLIINQANDYNCDGAVEEHLTELALSPGPIDQTLFDATLLFSCNYSLIVNPSHPFANRDYVSVNDLKNIPVIILDKSIKIGTVYKHVCEKAGFKPKISMEVKDHLVIYLYAEENLGVGISTETLARRLNMTTIKAIPFIEPEMSWNLYLIKLKNIALSKNAQLFKDILLSTTDNDTVNN
jgi:DNA-binding transcriptional LysR family regulator